VLGLVEPQSSTIAGSGFMMYYDAKTKQVTAYDAAFNTSQPAFTASGVFATTIYLSAYLTVLPSL
jgi:gamma-glutamyltranspeptidase